MAQLRVELEPINAVKQEIAGLIDRIASRRHPDALQFRSSLQSISDAAFGASDTHQAVHGDASLSNLLTTTDGRRLWADFEDVRRGPVEADVAGLADAARNRRLGGDYERALLAGYGDVDQNTYAAQMRLNALYGAVWRAYHSG